MLEHEKCCFSQCHEVYLPCLSLFVSGWIDPLGFWIPIPVHFSWCNICTCYSWYGLLSWTLFLPMTFLWLLQSLIFSFFLMCSFAQLFHWEMSWVRLCKLMVKARTLTSKKRTCILTTMVRKKLRDFCPPFVHCIAGRESKTEQLKHHSFIFFPIYRGWKMMFWPQLHRIEFLRRAQNVIILASTTNIITCLYAVSVFNYIQKAIPFWKCTACLSS